MKRINIILVKQPGGLSNLKAQAFRLAIRGIVADMGLLQPIKGKRMMIDNESLPCEISGEWSVSLNN